MTAQNKTQEKAGINIFRFVCSLLLAAAAAGIFSCSGEDSPDLPSSNSTGEQSSDSAANNYCVSASAQQCIKTTDTSCPAGWELRNNCPFGGSEPKSYEYCIYVEAERCFKGPYTECPGGGLLNNSCPFSETKSYEYCIYVEAQRCFKGPYTECPGGGLLNNSCPFESSGNGASSSAGGGGLPEYAYCVYSAEAECFDGPFTSCIANGILSNDCPFPRGGASSATVIVSSSSVAVIISSSSAGGGIVVGSGGPVSVYGELKASGNRLVGSKTGTAVQVRGVSLFWSNTGWGGDRFFNAATVNAMVDSWKAEVIRVPIGYSESGGYATDASNLTRVKAAVEAAIAKDVYVVIDWHSHNAHNELSAAASFFAEMARTYGGYNHVIFEIYNEPLNISWAAIKTYAGSIISTIRQHSDNLVLVGTPNWDQDVNVAASSPISDANVAYVFHFYAYTHPLSSFQSKINAVLNAGYPVFVSEYGTTDAEGGNPNDGNYNTHNASASDAWHTFMDNNKISSCAWSVSDKYEGSAFFGTGTAFDMVSWTNTSKMTAHGQYIYNKLRNPPSGGTPSSSSGGTGLYCDYGPGNSGGEGGCYEIEDASVCDLEWGKLASRCGRTDQRFCIYEPWEGSPGGCYLATDEYKCVVEDYGRWVTRCPGFSYPGVD